MPKPNHNKRQNARQESAIIPGLPKNQLQSDEDPNPLFLLFGGPSESRTSAWVGRRRVHLQLQLQEHERGWAMLKRYLLQVREHERVWSMHRRRLCRLR